MLGSPPLFALSGICGTYFVLWLASHIHGRLFTLIGENSLIIMGTHQLVLYTVPARSDILWIACVFVLIAAVEAAFIFAINRFCPWLIGKTGKGVSHDGVKTGNGA